MLSRASWEYILQTAKIKQVSSQPHDANGLIANMQMDLFVFRLFFFYPCIKSLCLLCTCMSLFLCLLRCRCLNRLSVLAVPGTQWLLGFHFSTEHLSPGCLVGDLRRITPSSKRNQRWKRRSPPRSAKRRTNHNHNRAHHNHKLGSIIPVS